MNANEPADQPLRTADGRPIRSAEDVLPPVQAPSAGFLLQLFFIPLIIVLIIVAVWGMFSWLVQLGSDPRDLVAEIRTLNDASWQKAYLLADFLRNPEYDRLKEDKQIARELADVLDREIDDANMNEKRVLLRLYLCRVLGEFRVPDVVPVLVKAATTERDAAEMDVRRAAAQALAVLADELGPETLRANEDVMSALLEMSRERGQSADDAAARGELRSSAAYALGVIGGPQALDRLERLLGDVHSNTRYNAATGLARHGDERAQPVLIEMLDPARPATVDSAQQSKSEEAQTRYGVMAAGIAASAKLAEAGNASELGPLKKALRKLSTSDVPNRIRAHAKEALLTMNAR